MDIHDFFGHSEIVLNAECVLATLGGLPPFTFNSNTGNSLAMETYDQQYFHTVLTQHLKDLLKKGDETVSLLLNSSADSAELVDQATHETDRSLRLRIGDRENRLTRKINQSLARIEDGTFGICEICGEDIALNRLKARPVTTYCIACKNKMEAREKAAGI